MALCAHVPLLAVGFVLFAGELIEFVLPGVAGPQIGTTNLVLGTALVLLVQYYPGGP